MSQRVYHCPVVPFSVQPTREFYRRYTLYRDEPRGLQSLGTAMRNLGYVATAAEQTPFRAQRQLVFRRPDGFEFRILVWVERRP